MNARLGIAIFAILSTICSAAAAQDHLEPEEGLLNLDAENWSYAEKLHSVLLNEAPFYHLARMVCLSSNQAEWIVTGDPRR